MARNIKVIPSTVPLHAVGPVVTGAKRRVAAYARVSTDRDEQFTSYEAQIDYYTNYIKSRPDWEFVSVYSDEGKTGCNTRKREGFKNMIDDALDGKIDLIVTKSVSRFARNTVDSLTTIRKLKDRGVEVYFEKEKICGKHSWLPSMNRMPYGSFASVSSLCSSRQPRPKMQPKSPATISVSSSVSLYCS